MNRAVLFLLAVLIIPAFGDFRLWQTKSGQTTEAEFVKMQGTKAVLRTRSGKMVPIDPNLFIDEDQRYIKLQVPLKLEIKADDEEVTKPSTGNFMMAWFEQHMKVEATVRQKGSADYPGTLKLTLLQIGEHDQSGNEAIMGKSEHSLTLPTTKTFENTTTFLKKSSSSLKVKERHYKYKGYAIFITDEFGKIIASESSPSSYEKQGNQLLTLETGAEFDKNFEPIDPAAGDGNYVAARNPENWVYTWKGKEIGRPAQSKDDISLFARSKYGVTKVFRPSPIRVGETVSIEFSLTEGKVGVTSLNLDEITIPVEDEAIHTLKISNHSMVFTFNLDGNDIPVRTTKLRHNNDSRPFYYFEVDKSATLKVHSISQKVDHSKSIWK